MVSDSYLNKKNHIILDLKCTQEKLGESDGKSKA